MKFIVDYDKQPKRFLKKLDQHIVKRLMDKIDTLGNNPIPSDAKVIVGKHGIFRIRIGDFRVLYRVNYSNNKVVVVKIDKRARIY